MERTGKEVDNIITYSILKRSLSSNYSRTLETLLEPETQLQILRKQKTNILPAKVLYNHGILEHKIKVYEHYDGNPIKVNNENSQIELGFIFPKATIS